ncbi:MAG TPA: thioesterase family protein [Gemmatimonadales bacterium]|nr:thioesterase family protein [Gemmatimonadales bacterium]
MHQPITETVTTHRVNYSETDQMGVVYHARHIVWLDVARTEHLRQAGYSYRELEAAGVRLVVTELSVRYRQALRFDEIVRIRCRVRDVAPRRVVFAYRLERADSGALVGEAETTLWCLDHTHRPSRLPDAVVRALGGAATR